MSLNYGLRISQPGYDVKTCTDEQCVLTSKSNTLKHYLTGTTTIVIPSGTGTATSFNVTVNHALEFVPVVRIFPNDGTYATSISLVQSQIYPNTRMIDRIILSYTIDSSNLKIYLRTSDAGGSGFPFGFDITITFKYYIFTQEMT